MIPKAPFRAHALFVGQRIDLRSVDGDRIATAPLVVSLARGACAVVFRYGAVVLFGADANARSEFLNALQPAIGEAFDDPERDEADIAIDGERPDRVEDDVILLQEVSVERLQVVALVLARSLVLAEYEHELAQVFDSIEPLARDLQRQRRAGWRARELLRHIGGTLVIQHKMVGRVEVSDKPELLWENPKLERLFLRLSDEYELHERQIALDRKLQLIARTVNTLLDLVQNNRSLRVEWYIVLLILVEILLTLYSLFR